MGLHGMPFIPPTTQVDVSTTSNAYQTALDVSGAGVALIYLSCDAANHDVIFQITVDGNVVISDWVADATLQGAVVLTIPYSTALKVEYKNDDNASAVNCEIAYQNI